jgi:trans-aconitate 2-methyltransferase
MAYLFKDTDIAAQRLQILADVFASSTQAFLQNVVTREPQLALDLGCGPGYTTHLLSDTTQAIQTIGLDSSEHFIMLANESSTTSISYIHHDVTKVPFPTGQSDLIFCRMLLTHLQDPQAIIERWGTQLRPSGILLIEEVDWIETQFPLFRTYLSIVAKLLEQQENQLYIGPLLDTQQNTRGLQRVISRVYRLPVSTAWAAKMFSMNIPAWKNQAFIRQTYTDEMIERFEHELQILASSSTATSDIEWGMRQVAYRRI